MNRKVSFTAMDHGTRKDYDLVEVEDARNSAELADRVLDWLQHYGPLVRELFARPSRTFL